jgi:ATP-dependent DNA ligase
MVPERRARLEALLAGADADLLRFSEAFDDAEKLLAAALELGLEGIVSKKRHQPYRSGKNIGWAKVKTAAWREANRDTLAAEDVRKYASAGVSFFLPILPVN